MALPLTLLVGSEGLVVVTEKGAAMGLAVVIALVFGKMLATAGALSTGFIGGPIFPLFFVGGAAGTAINLIFPGIPLALAVGCMMAALTAAALPAPLMITIVVPFGYRDTCHRGNTCVAGRHGRPWDRLGLWLSPPAVCTGASGRSICPIFVYWRRATA